ncbi:MAG: hypothetical protein J5925_04900, partial [Clostridia bacterium]|nr:hypothetical protein [Clostridia bacterium]
MSGKNGAFTREKLQNYAAGAGKTVFRLAAFFAFYFFTNALIPELYNKIFTADSAAARLFSYDFSATENAAFSVANVFTALLLFFTLYSFPRVFVLHDLDFADRCDKTDLRDSTFAARVRFALGDRFLYYELACCAALYLLIPAGDYAAVMYGMLFGGTVNTANKFILFAVMLPSAFLLLLTARLSVIKYRRNYRLVPVNRESEKAIRANRRKCAFAAVSAFAAYVIGTIAFSLLSLGLGALRVFITWKAVMIVAALLILPRVYRALYALRSRRVFIRKLKKECAAKGYKLSKIRCPYRSVFRVLVGENFTLEANGKTYSCRFIGGPRRSAPLGIMDNGTAVYYLVFKFFKMTLRERTREFRFGYESPYRKVLIVNPVPKSTLAAETNGQFVEIDNGDVRGDYIIYTGQAFLNALGRDTVDHVKKRDSADIWSAY